MKRIAVLVAAWLAAPAAAQTPLPLAHEPPKIGSTFTADVLRDLPAGANLFSILETTQADLVTDRFNSGGLNAGEPARVGGLLSSWSQTQYRIGDANITSPIDGGPLLFPEIAFWQRVDVTTGLMPSDINAPGLAVSLEPRGSSAQWVSIVEGSVSGSRLATSRVASEPPPILRLRDWSHASVLVSGPVLERRLGLVIGSTWTRNLTLERADPDGQRGEIGSAFAHAVFTPATGTELRTLGWVQRTRTTTHDLSAHLQSTYERPARGRTSWRIFSSYTQRRRIPANPISASLILDRLVDGPIPAGVRDRDSTERRWSVGARVSPSLSTERHMLQLGTEFERTSARALPFAGVIGELIDRLPARVWVYTNPGLESKRHATMLAAFARDRITLSPRLTLDAWLRFESVDGRADGAPTGIGWETLLPSATIRWDLGTPYDLAVVTGYRRSSNQLLLGLLAYGDPTAPVAEGFRWDAALAASGPPIARVGPGTGGDPAFSRIDPELKRPHTDEFIIGLDSHPRSTLRFGVMGIARRQSPLINVVNTAVPIASYATFTIFDPNVDLIGTSDDHLLTIYNRLPESFARDQYLLTNPEQDAATMGAVVVTAQASSDRLFLLIGATASAAVGSGGNRGFRAIENDQDMPGELFTNPNATTFARGRLFSDRAYTIKWTALYRFPREITIGAIARYQDGQPFSRVVVVPGLNQGPEVIQAFANGRSRFAFAGTLDLRIQKGLVLGATRLDAILDAYNLLNMKKEVEEYVVTGDRFRETTAVQPPRAFHLGLRLAF